MRQRDAPNAVQFKLRSTMARRSFWCQRSHREVGGREYNPDALYSPGSHDQARRDWLEREAIIKLAGSAAERAGTGCCDGSHENQDYQEALRRIGWISGDVDECRAYVKWLYHRARLLVERHWPAVEAVAQALADQRILTGVAARHIARAAA